ncbi:MAG: response regulator [Acidobacteriota bacterium]
MSKTIIWIEDDYDIIEPVIYPLRKAGYKVINIENTKEAVEKLAELKNADLILLDMFLPKGSGGKNFGEYPGYMLLKELRDDCQITTPVVVLTVISNGELRTELEKLVIDGIIYKPVRPSKLKEIVDEVFQKYEAK